MGEGTAEAFGQLPCLQEGNSGSSPSVNPTGFSGQAVGQSSEQLATGEASP